VKRRREITRVIAEETVVEVGSGEQEGAVAEGGEFERKEGESERARMRTEGEG
jgi:hypothetical protein